MLEKPAIDEQLIISRLKDEYGLHNSRVTFLPLGYDLDTAVYRVITNGTAYFLKLRKGRFDEMTVAVPQFLNSLGIQAIISPLETRNRQLWGSIEGYKMILYPFIEGENAYHVDLSDQHWILLGETLKRIHTTELPPEFIRLIPRESYSPRWRELVKIFQAQVESETYPDPTAAKLARFMQSKRDEISHLVVRAEQLGLALQASRLHFVLCHSDIHPGNLHISSDRKLYIVDWDNPIFAPKERDLMFMGAGMGNGGPGGREEALFYRGYNATRPDLQEDVDLNALAYYRYERIIQDFAAFCQQLLLTVQGGEDREQSYHYFTSQFLLGHEIDAAIKTDPG